MSYFNLFNILLSLIKFYILKIQIFIQVNLYKLLFRSLYSLKCHNPGVNLNQAAPPHQKENDHLPKARIENIVNKEVKAILIINGKDHLHIKEEEVLQKDSVEMQNRFRNHPNYLLQILTLHWYFFLSS